MNMEKLCVDHTYPYKYVINKGQINTPNIKKHIRFLLEYT